MLVSHFQRSKNNENCVIDIDGMNERQATKRSKWNAASAVAPADFSFIHKTMCLFYVGSHSCFNVSECESVCLFSHCASVFLCLCILFPFHYTRLRILNVRLNMLSHKRYNSFIVHCQNNNSNYSRSRIGIEKLHDEKKERASGRKN